MFPRFVITRGLKMPKKPVFKYPVDYLSRDCVYLSRNSLEHTFHAQIGKHFTIENFALPGVDYSHYTKEGLTIYLNRTSTIQAEDFYGQELLSNPPRNRALLVPYEHLHKLRRVFPAIHVPYFENSDHYYFPRRSPRHKYDTIIDCRDDKDLWSREDAMITDPFEVDVIIHASLNPSIESTVMDEISQARWKETKNQVE
jgi:hypothetical protein